MLCHSNETRPWPPGYLGDMGERLQFPYGSTSMTTPSAGVPEDFISNPDMPDIPGDSTPLEGRCLSVEVQRELHALREQLVSHHGQLLALVSKRLDSLLARCGGTGDNIDPSGDIPKLQVSLPVHQQYEPIAAWKEVARANSCHSAVERRQRSKMRPMSTSSSMGSGRERRSLASFGFQRPSDIQAAASREDTLQQMLDNDSDGKLVSGPPSTKSMSLTKPRLHRTMFARPELMQDKLNDMVLRKEYHVEEKYSTHGPCQQIAKSSWFEIVTLLVIFMNTLWIGYDVDKNPAEVLPDAPILFQVVENGFCFYFTFELLIRFGAFEYKLDAIKDAAFLFDSALLVVMIGETWFAYIFSAIGQSGLDSPLASLLRMLRLSRMVRLVRLLRAMPELMMLIRGLKAACPSVAWALGFLIIVIYVFSVAFNIMCKNNDLGDRYFPSVLDGMSTLLLPGVFSDSAKLILEFGSEHILYAAVFVCYAVVGTIMVMNLLIGVLCEVVSGIAAMEKEELNVSFVKDTLKDLMDTLDRDKNGLLSKDEVEQLVMMPGASRIMNDVDVDVVAFCEIAEFYLFDRSEEISFEDFVSLVLKFRDSNNVCFRDIVFLRHFIAEEIGGLEQRLLGGGLCCKPPADDRMTNAPTSIHSLVE